MKLKSFFFIPIVFLFLPYLALSEDIPLEKRVQSFELSNGLKVIILERHLSPTVALYLTYRAGAVDEEEGKTGIAHFLEHMMFKGTKTIGTRNYEKEKRLLRKIWQTGKRLDRELKRGAKAEQNKVARLQEALSSLQRQHRKWVRSNEIDRLYTEAGAINVNASTGQDLTTYHVNLPANKIELWARIESERMKDTVLREFYEERNVILEERRQTKEANPQGALYEEFMSIAFLRHPYRRPIIGFGEDIAHIQPEDLLRFKRNFYAPNNATIAIVGDVDAKKVLFMVKRYFGSLQRAPIVRPDIPVEPAPNGERRLTLAIQASPQLIIGFHKPPPPHPDDYVFDLIETLLSGGRASRLYKKLVEEKALAQAIEAQNGLPGARYNNLFAIFARPRDGKTNGELEAAIYDLLEELKSGDIPEAELEAAKTKLTADFIRLQESNEGMAHMLAYNQAVLGNFRYAFTYLDRIREITPADIRRVAQKYLTKSSRLVATIERP